MDLGTAKPTPERDEVDYHLLDLVDPSEEFTVAQFQAAARARRRGRCLAARRARCSTSAAPGLYGRAVLDNFEIPGQYPEVRGAVRARRARRPDGVCTKSSSASIRWRASRMEPTNARRIVRALEVTLGSGPSVLLLRRGSSHLWSAFGSCRWACASSSASSTSASNERFRRVDGRGPARRGDARSRARPAD